MSVVIFPPRATAVKYSDSGSLDAFGRVRISNPFTVFDSKQDHDNQPLFWGEALESGASITSAHSDDTASTVITSTLNTAGVFTRQTFQRFNYQPGKSQLILLTGILDRSGGGTGVTRSIGSFDNSNGLFFSDIAGTINVVRRTNVTGTPVDNPVVQTAWNIDTMNGGGPSGVTIDWTKTQIFVIDYEWLGVGRVRMGLNVDGNTYYVHQFLNANVLSKVYMSTPNLPLRYQMTTTASSPASTMECICATVVSEGGHDAAGPTLTFSTNGTHVDANTENTTYAVVGIRLASAYIGTQITVLDFSMAVHTASSVAMWKLLWNATIAGSPSYGAVTGSSIEAFAGATANTITGGTLIAGGFIETAGVAGGGAGSTAASINNALRLGSTIAGVVDTLALCVMPIGGSTNIDVEGSITWLEGS